MSHDNAKLHLFFPTPIWTTLIENNQKINNDIYKYILSLQSENPKGIQKSNFKGWHSKDFDLKNYSVINFINSISPYLENPLKDMNWDLKKQKVNITSMWSIINNKESSNARHIHGNNYISAAYYVKAPKKCGNIVFYDPRSAAAYSHPIANTPNKLNATSHSVEPKEDLLILFPSYLHHSVDPNTSNENRIVISFNINLINI